MTKHTNTFDSAPAVGQRVTGHSDGPGYHSTWSGIYDGVRPSEWDGVMYHYMRDGEINGTPQSIFGHPVAQTAAPACTHEWNWYANESTGDEHRWYCIRCGVDKDVTTNG